MANKFSGLSNFLTLITIFTKTKEFKGMKQQLKVFRLRLRQFNVFYWASLQNKRLTAVNTSQMVMIPIHRAIESLTCWKVPTPHQPFLLKSTKVSINRSQTHVGRTFDQCAVKLLAADLISTIVQFFQYLFLTGRQTDSLFDHALAIESQTLPKISLLVP